MKFFAATAAFIGLAAAAKVTDATIRDNKGLQSVTLTIDGTKCSANAGQLGARQVVCPGAAYSYHIDGSPYDYTITLFKGVKTDAPSAYGKLPVVCHTGGAGVDDQVCNQTSELAIDI